VLFGFACHDGLPIPQPDRVPVAVARVAGMAGSNVSIDYNGAPVAVTLDATGSSDADGKIVAYRWLSGTPAKPSTGSAGAAAGTGASGMGASGASGASAGASGASAGASGASAGASGAGTVAGGGAGATGAAGMTTTGSAGSAAISGTGRWVPPGQPADWPPDEAMTTVTLDQGVYTFVLWVVDNRGEVSDPSTLQITISAPLDPAVKACVDGVAVGPSRGCATCVCQESDTCRMAAAQSTCGADCWGLLNCIATMCPTFMPGGDTSCLASKCGSYLGGATGATAIGACIQPACTAQCQATN
jgi:hypothetical protein